MSGLVFSFGHSNACRVGNIPIIIVGTYAAVGNNLCICVYVMMIGWLLKIYWCCAPRSWRMTHKV